MTYEEKTLAEAMSYAKVPKLPEEYKATGMKIWARAIVKVKKYNGRSNYALAVNDGSGSPRVVKDFGEMVGIKTFEAIYPYEYVTDEKMPSLRNKKDIIAFLGVYGYNEGDITTLLSNTDAEGNAKTDEQKASDKALVKSYIEKIALKEILKH